MSNKINLIKIIKSIMFAVLWFILSKDVLKVAFHNFFRTVCGTLESFIVPPVSSVSRGAQIFHQEHIQLSFLKRTFKCVYDV